MRRHFTWCDGWRDALTSLRGRRGRLCSSSRPCPIRTPTLAFALKLGKSGSGGRRMQMAAAGKMAGDVVYRASLVGGARGAEDGQARPWNRLTLLAECQTPRSLRYVAEKRRR